MKPKKSGNRGRCRKLSLFPLDSFSLLRDLLDIFLPINSHINSINETANDHISMNALIIYLSNGFAGRIVITSFARQILDFCVLDPKVNEPTWRCHQNPFIGALGIYPEFVFKMCRKVIQEAVRIPRRRIRSSSGKPNVKVSHGCY